MPMIMTHAIIQVAATNKAPSLRPFVESGRVQNLNTIAVQIIDHPMISGVALPWNALGLSLRAMSKTRGATAKRVYFKMVTVFLDITSSLCNAEGVEIKERPRPPVNIGKERGFVVFRLCVLDLPRPATAWGVSLDVDTGQALLFFALLLMSKPRRNTMSKKSDLFIFATNDEYPSALSILEELELTIRSPITVAYEGLAECFAPDTPQYDAALETIHFCLQRWERISSFYGIA